MNPTVAGRGAPPGDDSGQAAPALVVVMFLAVLACFVFVVAPVGAATDDRSRSQGAADAAALAGAEEIRTTWVFGTTRPGVLTFPAGPRRAVSPASGGADAADYAARNGSRVVAYRADLARGRTFARVRSTSSAAPENGSAQASATAEMDAAFTRCRWNDADPPEPLPDGPQTFPRTLTCGEWSADYVIRNTRRGDVYSTISYGGGDSSRAVFDALEPRLVR